MRSWCRMAPPENSFADMLAKLSISPGERTRTPHPEEESAELQASSRRPVTRVPGRPCYQGRATAAVRHLTHCDVRTGTGVERERQTLRTAAKKRRTQR